MPVDATSASSCVAAPRELLSGIDSLDLTCKVPAPAALLRDLAGLKIGAGEDARRAVVLPVGDEFLRVAASGLGPWWPYRLEHRFGQLGVGESPNRPAWKVSLAAEALHVEGAGRVVQFWRGVIEALTGAPVVLMASRLDVHADFAGLGIGDDDLSAFVCRSGRQSVERQDGALETVYWGKGGEVVGRMYDKLAEVHASGKGGFLLGAYGNSGLRDGEHVHRVEFQFRGKALRGLGVATAEDALAQAGAVYLYAVTKWLRLVDSDSASRRERASVDRRWLAVQAARIGAGFDAAARVAAEQHAPQIDVLIPMINGLMVAAGAALGVADPDDVWRQVAMLAGGYRDDNGRDFTAEVQARRLEFGSSAA